MELCRDTQEESSIKTFRILLPFISRLVMTNEKISSKPFMLAGIHWKVSLQQKEGKNAIACSVEICEPHALSQCALYVGSFTVTLISLLDSDACRTYSINKPFTTQKSSWRIEKFISTDKLFDPRNEFVLCNSAMLKVEAVVYSQ
ncbi:hypothetical protein PRIPAC_83740 [Pristionchus pacificus]|nr:hypothetical protein PRIPAC_83740 [Pristionchus pacificus]